VTSAFDYKGQPSIWLRDKQLKRYIQGDDSAKKRQEKGDINDKNQVLIYSRSLSNKKWLSRYAPFMAEAEVCEARGRLRLTKA
jgi:hypothetical protein